MSYRDDNIERRRASLHNTREIAMGLFFFVIGAILLYKKSFGNYEINKFVAYILGSIMLVGGGIRFYRGVMAILLKKKDNDQTRL
jgi:hypothetical protein